MPLVPLSSKKFSSYWKLALLVVLIGATIIYPLYSFLIKPIFTYERLQEQTENLNGRVIDTVSCGESGYAWQVSYSAQASQANFETGPAELSVRRELSLLFHNEIVKGVSSQDGYSSFRTLDQYSKAFIHSDVVDQMKSWSKENYQPERVFVKRWSFLSVPSETVTNQSFEEVASCLATNYSRINTAFSAETPENTSQTVSRHRPLGGVVLLDGVYTKEHRYTCDTGEIIFDGGEWVRLVGKDKVKDWESVIGVVGLDGIMRPSIPPTSGGDYPGNYHAIPKDMESLKQFSILENAVLKSQCVDKAGRDLREVMRTIPERTQVFRVNN